MKKQWFIGMMAWVMGLPAIAHVWDELAILARPNNEGTFTLEKYSFLQPTTYTNAVFFDFDNDENLDLLIMGQGGDWNISGDIKFVTLYRNLGADEDFRFERVPDAGFLQRRDEGFYNPISTGDFNHDGYTDVLIMSNQNGRHIDLYLNDKGTGRFIRQEIDFEAATNGSVMFGDLNNDGWLDIEYSGYSDKTSTALKTYINQQNGSFADLTPDNLTGAFQGQSTLADINGDGTLDIISTGNGDNQVCLAPIYYNTTDGSGHLSFRHVPETESGILGVSRANPLVADFNADGRMDMIINGEPGDDSGFRNRIYYQNEEGKFTMDTSYPIVPVNQDGGINMGDWNGDGNMDIIVGGYIGTRDANAPACYSSPLRVYENKPEKNGLKGNTFPDAPGDVSAEMQGTELVIKPFGDGKYTVGVQTLDQSYAGSTFRTCTLEVNTRVASASLSEQFKIIKNGHNIEVKSPLHEQVKVYGTDGCLVAHGTTNETIVLPTHGTFLVSAGTYKEKVLF